MNYVVFYAVLWEKICDDLNYMVRFVYKFTAYDKNTNYLDSIFSTCDWHSYKLDIICLTFFLPNFHS